MLYVSRVVSNSKIYGSLGLVPVFMIGLYFSWLILLFGRAGGLCVSEPGRVFRGEAGREHQPARAGIRRVAADDLHWAAVSCGANRRQRLTEISEALAVPTRLVQQIMQTLCAARLVTETAGAETGLPARAPAGAHHLPRHPAGPARQPGPGTGHAGRAGPREVYGEFHRIEEAERQAACSVTMLALVNRAQGPKELQG